MSKSSSSQKRVAASGPLNDAKRKVGWVFNSVGKELATDLKALSGAEARFEEAVAEMAAAHSEIRALMNRQRTPRQKISQSARPTLVDAKIKLLNQAKVLLGDLDAAASWVREPIQCLDSQTPFQLIETPEGTASLADYMGQIKYGVYI
jgi:Protein of unknown function (DUF2384)